MGTQRWAQSMLWSQNLPKLCCIFLFPSVDSRGPHNNSREREIRASCSCWQASTSMLGPCHRLCPAAAPCRRRRCPSSLRAAACRHLLHQGPLLVLVLPLLSASQPMHLTALPCQLRCRR